MGLPQVIGSVLVFIVLQAVTGTASAQNEQKLRASDGEESDLFGRAVDISGDYAVIGAQWDQHHDARSGSAYIFERIGGAWTEIKKLVPPNAADDMLFGSAVAVHEDIVVVGAWRDDVVDLDSGSAFVFRNLDGAWTFETKLVPSDAKRLDAFGDAVDVSGNTIIIGSSNNQGEDGTLPGAAYIFEFDGTVWTEAQKLTASDAGRGDLFGWAVAVDDGSAMVGARGDNDAGDDSGSAYIFRYSNGVWVEEQKLTASDAREDDFYGASVSIEKDIAVVGAQGTDVMGDGSGSVYTYHRVTEGWSGRANYRTVRCRSWRWLRKKC